MKKPNLVVLILFLSLLWGCTKNTPPKIKSDLTVSFTHTVHEHPVVLNQMQYINANGDTFSIKTIKYFISKFTLFTENGGQLTLPHYWYIDINDPESLQKNLLQQIPHGTYSGFSFILGFTNEDNVSNMFTSNPEYLMFWPENMGGGYHYQKLEGQYLKNGMPHNFNFHSGGLDKTDYSIQVIENLPFTASQNLHNLTINMEIQNWFKSPVTWDFQYFGAGIMQNHEAQETIQQNGHDVFSFTILK